jgi:signal transduction histidine kinase
MRSTIRASGIFKRLNIQTQLVLTSIVGGLLAVVVVAGLARLLLVSPRPIDAAINELDARVPAVEQAVAANGDSGALRQAAIPGALPAGARVQVFAVDGSLKLDSVIQPPDQPASVTSGTDARSDGLKLVRRTPIVVNGDLWGFYVYQFDFEPPTGINPGILALVLGTGLLVGALPFWWLGRRLARALRRLTEVVGHIARGHLGARADLLSSADELGQLARDINRMAASLQNAQQHAQAADEARRFTVASVSHDVRTPLTALLAHAEALSSGVSEDPKRSLEVVRTRALRLKVLVDDLFELAALDASPGPWSTDRLDLSEVVRESVASALPDLESRGLEVRVDIPDEPIWALLAPGKVDRVVDNLVANARNYGAAGGWLHVHVCRSDGRARVEVIDGGVGVAAEDQPHIFERFYRADAARNITSGGTGLGLAIAREIILHHGGRIGLDSPAEGGTCVWFELPIVS